MILYVATGIIHNVKTLLKDNSSANHGFNIAMMSDIKSQTPDDIFMDVLQNSLKSCSFWHHNNSAI